MSLLAPEPSGARGAAWFHRTHVARIDSQPSHHDRSPIEATESETVERIRVQSSHFTQDADRHLLALQQALHRIAAVVNAGLYAADADVHRKLVQFTFDSQRRTRIRDQRRTVCVGGDRIRKHRSAIIESPINVMAAPVLTPCAEG